VSESGASYEECVHKALRDLGIPLDLVRRRNLELCTEAPSLVVADVDARGREQQLSPAAAQAWTTMKAAAAGTGIALYLISANRSVSAPPGYSEHHTCRAIDIGASPADPLEEAFEGSEAFKWLVANAPRHGFHLSYPRDNRYGYRYEPWHWLYRDRK
jgi:D-alanyl-D-alanine carboxypeptidase